MIKRFSCALALTVCFISVNVAADNAGKFGFCFGIGNVQNVGVIYHFNDVYALNPSLTLTFDANKNSEFGVDILNRFYLGNIRLLEQYFNVGIGFHFTETGNGTTSGFNIPLWALYGLQYPINDQLALFGQLGLENHHYNSNNNDTWNFNLGGIYSLGITLYF